MTEDKKTFHLSLSLDRKKVYETLREAPSGAWRQFHSVVENASIKGEDMVWEVSLERRKGNRFVIEPYMNPAILQREFRSQILQDTHLDIDIVNARVGAYLYGFEKYELDTPKFLKELYTDRETIFEKWISSGYAHNRDDCKQNVNALLGFSWKIFEDEWSQSARKCWEKVGKRFTDCLIVHDPNVDQLTYGNKIDYGKTINQFYLETESQCFEKLVEHFDHKIDSYQYDGGTIRKDLYRAEYLENVNADMPSKWLRFEIKSMKRSSFLEHSIEQSRLEATKQLDRIKFSLLSYEEQKIEFEKFFGYCKVSKRWYERSAYGHFEKDLTTLKQELSCLTTTIRTMDGDKPKTEKKAFLTRYLNDPQRKQYIRPDSHYDESKIEEGCFNIFTPYAPTKKTLPSTYDTYVKAFRKLVSFLTNDLTEELGYVDYVCDWISDAFLNPLERRSTKVALVFAGQKGVGKGVFSCEILKWIFRDRVLTTSKNSQVFGEFNSICLGKNIVVLDEMKINEQEFDRFKYQIVNNKMDYMSKGVDGFQANNLSSFIVNSNNENPIRIDARTGVRRLAVFEPSTLLRDNKDKNPFGAFSAAFGPNSPNHKDFCDCMYHYFLTRDIQINNFQEQAPKTKALKALTKRALGAPLLFMEWAIKNYKFWECDTQTAEGYVEELAGENGRNRWKATYNLYFAESSEEYYELPEYKFNIAVTKDHVFNAYKEFIATEYNAELKRVKKATFFADLEKTFGISFDRMSIQGMKINNVAVINPKLILSRMYKNNWLSEYEGEVEQDEPVPEAKAVEETSIDSFIQICDNITSPKPKKKKIIRLKRKN